MIGRVMFAQYIKSHEAVMLEIKNSTGIRPEPYKNLEEKLLLAFFDNLETKKNMNGLDFIADMLSTLVVDQALPNANHRTALYFIGSLLKQNNIEIDTMLHAETIREYFLDSKQLLKKAPKDYKKRHLNLTKSFIVKILGSAQSGRLGSIFAYSLMNSFAASSKDIGFLTGSAMDEE
jgi:prophage maintenance system killer protein